VRLRSALAVIAALSVTACGVASPSPTAAKGGSPTLLAVQMLEYGGPSPTNLVGAEARAGHSFVTLHAGSKTLVVTGNGHGLATVNLDGYAGPVTISLDGAPHVLTGSRRQPAGPCS